MTENGIKWIASDASDESYTRVIGSATTVPRHPIDLDNNTATAEQVTDQFNWRFTSRAFGGVAVAGLVAGLVANPYMEYPNMPLVLACGALVGGLTAGISIQLRSGRAVGAMVLALFSAALVVGAAIVSVWDYHFGEAALITAGAILVGVVAPIASRCLTQPQSW